MADNETLSWVLHLLIKVGSAVHPVRLEFVLLISVIRPRHVRGVWCPINVPFLISLGFLILFVNPYTVELDYKFCCLLSVRIEICTSNKFFHAMHHVLGLQGSFVGDVCGLYFSRLFLHLHHMFILLPLRFIFGFFCKVHSPLFTLAVVF